MSQQFIITEELKEKLVELLSSDLPKLIKMLHNINMAALQNDKHALRLYESDDIPKITSIEHRLKAAVNTLWSLPVEKAVALAQNKNLIEIAIQSGKLYGMLEAHYFFAKGVNVQINSQEDYQAKLKLLAH